MLRLFFWLGGTVKETGLAPETATVSICDDLAILYG
jgi:hypothetical protein